MAVPGDQNIKGKQLQKITNNQDLRLQAQMLWSAKATVILVVVGALGTVKTGFQRAHFSASAEFFACANFSAYLNSNFNHNADCLKIQILRDLDKLKIANISNIKLSTPLLKCKKQRFSVERGFFTRTKHQFTS